MKLKNEQAEIIAIKKQAETRTIQTAVKLADNQENKMQLLEIAKHNDHNKLEQILPKMNSQATAVLFPIYSAFKG